MDTNPIRRGSRSRASRCRSLSAPPAGVDEGARAERGLALLRGAGAPPRPAPAHDLRGGALPEHRRVLGPRHRHVPDPRRHLHARLPLLLRPLRASRTRRPTRSSRSGSPQAAAQMGLKHVVVTSVDRDDLPDRGAGHYAATIRALKKKLPEASVEVLTPDFLGVEEEALATVLAARPEVFNHNIETVRRLHRRMRGAKASYDKALWLLAAGEGGRRLPGADEVGDHRRPRRDERRGRRDDARPAGARRRRRHDRPVPAAVLAPRARSTAGCTPTSSAGSASRARRSASARSSRGRSCARRTGPTSSDTPPRRGRGAVAY